MSVVFYKHPISVAYVNVMGETYKAVCGSYSTAALRHIVLLPE